jgi:hypothetical protein
MKNSEIIIFKTSDEKVSVNVIMENENVWLTQDQMAKIFGVQRQAITKHLINIYNEGELEENSTSSILEQVQKEANRTVKRAIKFYNLDAITFFATVQNKLHYAVNKQTAAELIYGRADAEKEFMGLITFSGEIPVKKDIVIAKKFLEEEELQRLNRLVSAFFDLAELKAMEHKSMKMQDWIQELDVFTTSYGKGTLLNAGKISHKQALEKAEKEYKKYQVKTLSPVEKEYLESIKSIEKTVLKKSKK